MSPKRFFKVLAGSFGAAMGLTILIDIAALLFLGSEGSHHVMKHFSLIWLVLTAICFPFISRWMKDSGKQAG